MGMAAVRGSDTDNRPSKVQVLLHESALSRDHADDGLNESLAICSKLHVGPNGRGLPPDLRRPVQGTGKVLHAVRDASDDLRDEQVIEPPEGNVEGKPLAEKFVVHHRHHFSGNDLFTESLIAKSILFQRDVSPRGTVRLPYVLQDGSLRVHLPQEFQQRHLSSPGSSFVLAHILRFGRHARVRSDDGSHRPSEEEHRECLARKQ